MIRLVYIVAEIGVNFTSLTEAKTMISKAYHAGADAVKFQLFLPDQVEGHAQYDELANISKMLIDDKGIHKLKEYADNLSINLFATPMFPDAVEILEELQVNRYKIRYADRYNDELLVKVIATGKPFFISCDEQYTSNHQITTVYNQVRLMYVIPKYPPDTDDFRQVPQLFSEKHFSGYSNHFPSIAPALISVSRGCQIVEMHVKLTGTKPIDGAVSITFEQLRELVKLVSEMEMYQCVK